MFVTLLVVTFFISLAVCFIVERIFANPLDAILKRLIPDDINTAWLRYLKFALYVVGISSGVRIHQLERYITARRAEDVVLTLNADSWIIEVYRTIIGTLGGIAWMLLVFFVFALVAYVIVRISEFRQQKGTN